MKKTRMFNGIAVEPGSENVHADLGYADSDSMRVKAQLVAEISDLIRKRALTQTRAAETLGLTQTKVFVLLKCQCQGQIELDHCGGVKVDQCAGSWSFGLRELRKPPLQIGDCLAGQVGRLDTISQLAHRLFDQPSCPFGSFHWS